MYLVSFDVASAFDRVPHHRLMGALREYGVCPYIRRVIHGWLGGRTFQVQMRAHGETYLSGIRGITCGLPQGGVLSPLLWLLYFDGVVREIARCSDQQGTGAGEYEDFVYADDITSLVNSHSYEDLAARAREKVALINRVLEMHGLKLNRNKTQSLVLSPVYLPRGVFRRSPVLSFPKTATRVRSQYVTLARTDRTVVEFDPFELTDTQAGQHECRQDGREIGSK